MPTLFRRVRYWLARRRRDADLAEELEFHRRMAQERLEQSGMPTADAVHASRRTLGNVTLAREEAREVGGGPRSRRFPATHARATSSSAAPRPNRCAAWPSPRTSSPDLAVWRRSGGRSHPAMNVRRRSSG